MIHKVFSLRWFLVIVGCAAALLSVMPAQSSAVDTGPDWMHGQLTFEFVGNFTYDGRAEYTHFANIPQEYVTAKTNVGTRFSPRFIDQTSSAYPTAVGHMAYSQVLMLGQDKWG